MGDSEVCQERKSCKLLYQTFCAVPIFALRNMEENGYVSAIAAPEIMEACIDTTLTETVDASYFFGPEGRDVKLRNTQYPDISVVNRCSMIRDFGDKTVNVLEIWSRIKGDNLNSGIVYSYSGCCSGTERMADTPPYSGVQA